MTQEWMIHTGSKSNSNSRAEWFFWIFWIRPVNFTLSLNFCNLLGYEEYSAMRDQYMRSGQAFVLVLPVQPVDSDPIPTWEYIQDSIKQICSVKVCKPEDLCMCIAETKIDLADEPPKIFGPPEKQAQIAAYLCSSD